MNTSLRSSGEERRVPNALVGGSNPSGEAIRCPNGYRFKIVHRLYDSNGYVSDCLKTGDVEIYQFKLTKSLSGDEVGYVDLVKTSDGAWETHTALDVDEQGKGLVTLMYAKAIDFGLKHKMFIRSSFQTSLKAQRVWNSKRLNELYTIIRKDRKFYVLGRTPERDRQVQRGLQIPL